MRINFKNTGKNLQFKFVKVKNILINYKLIKIL